MSKHDIEQHAQRYSKCIDSQYSPWKTNLEEMAKKTVIKKVLKFVWTTLKEFAILKVHSNYTEQINLQFFDQQLFTFFHKIALEG